MTTVTEQKSQKSQRGMKFAISYKVALTLFALIFLGLGVLALKVFAFPNKMSVLSSMPFAPGAPAIQSPSIPDEELYVFVRRAGNIDHVLAFNPRSGKVERSFDAGYNSIVKLGSNRRILYVFNATQLSAINTDTGAALWTVNLPGSPFVAQATDGAWFSADERLIYLQGSPDNFHPHIFTVDTQTRSFINDFELPLPYPSNVDEAFPSVWKLAWDEKLVVTSRDQLFTFDLASGQTGDAIQLFGPGSIDRVPLNLPQTTFVADGKMDSEMHQLFLATSTQEILVVDLDTQPFTIQRVVSLPAGWQFAVANPLLVNPKEQTLYVQVKREDTPIINGLEVDDVWVYDIATWAQKSRFSLRDQLAKMPGNIPNNPAGLDLTNYGLTLLPDGRIYSISQRGLLGINQDPRGRLQANWLDITGEDPESFVWKSIVP